MANKRHKPEEIVQKLRQVDVLVGQGVARDLPWKKWSRLIERIRLIQTLIEGGKNEPQTQT
jgi:hypothetical protein